MPRASQRREGESGSVIAARAGSGRQRSPMLVARTGARIDSGGTAPRRALRGACIDQSLRRRAAEIALSAPAPRRPPRSSAAPASPCRSAGAGCSRCWPRRSSPARARRGGASLRSRSACASSGCSTEYVPAEPQHRCALGRRRARTSKPSARSMLSTPPRSCWPCCSVHGGWNASGAPRRCSGGSAPRRSAHACQCAAAARGIRPASSSREVARQVGDAAGLARVVGIVGERVAVFLDGDAAARRVHDDRLDRAGSDRPAATRRRCCGACGRAPPSWSLQVQADRAAAAGARRRPASGCRRRRARARSRC